MREVLVTGATGFIGGHLVHWLLKTQPSWTIYMLCRRKTARVRQLESLGAHLILGDLGQLSSLAALNRPWKFVFHVAGVVAGLKAHDYRVGNVTATQNLLQAILPHQKVIDRFVLVSSLAATGPAKDRGRPCIEADSDPVSQYGRSKLEAEQCVIQSGLPFTIIRPPVVFGPQDKGVFTLFQAVSRGVVPQFSGPLRYFSVVYVGDLVQAMVELAQKEQALGKTFFVHQSDPVSFTELAEGIQKAVGRRRVIYLRIPRMGLRLAAWMAHFWGRLRGQALPLNLDKVQEIEQIYWVSSCQQAEQLGVVCSTPLLDALGETALWYRQNRWL
jgi:nucleoside-diphosphate-sugar epimerase